MYNLLSLWVYGEQNAWFKSCCCYSCHYCCCQLQLTLHPGRSRATAGPGKLFSRGLITTSFRLKHPAIIHQLEDRRLETRGCIMHGRLYRYQTTDVGPIQSSADQFCNIFGAIGAPQTLWIPGKLYPFPLLSDLLASVNSTSWVWVELLLVDSARCDNDMIGDETDRVDHFHPHHMQTSQPLFPSSICAAAIDIIHLLEDVQVNSDGVAGTNAYHMLCVLRLLRYTLSSSSAETAAAAPSSSSSYSSFLTESLFTI